VKGREELSSALLKFENGLVAGNMIFHLSAKSPSAEWLFVAGSGNAPNGM
jgi:hypothetical protein